MYHVKTKFFFKLCVQLLLILIDVPSVFVDLWHSFPIYVGRSESKERFVIQRYLLIIGKKENMQVLLHTFTYFST